MTLCHPTRRPRSTPTAWLLACLIAAPAAWAGQGHDGAPSRQIYPAISGTGTPEYGSPDRQAIRGDTIYPTIPGTHTPYYGSSPERRMVRDGKVYRVIPGTITPDYGSGSYIIRP
jgi:hypothetical protein